MFLVILAMNCRKRSGSFTKRNKKGKFHMLRVYFGDRENVIYDSSVFFKHAYKDNWITEEFTKDIVADIDKSEVVNSNIIISPALGSISPLQLSRGVKALILMKHYPGKIFNASNCGDNCAKWILKLGEEKNFTVCLNHVMDFGSGNFDIRIMNHRNLIVHNMEEFLDAGIEYLRKIPS